MRLHFARQQHPKGSQSSHRGGLVMLKYLLAFVVALSVMCVCPAVAKNAKPMTNQDVINLVHAKVAQDSILMAIARSKPGFDTSAASLIELNKQGVPDTIVQAMIRSEDVPARATSKPSGNSHAATATAASGSFNPEEVILFDSAQRITMHYLSPEINSGAKALGFGGMRSYAVLRGERAVLRVNSTQPSFLLAVPSNAQPQSYFTLANFAVRKNGTREVTIGGGFMSYSSGIPKDRVVETRCEQYPDQSRAPSGFTIYRIIPVAPMSGGEYAMILHSGQFHVGGFFGMATTDSFFDFGIGG